MWRQRVVDEKDECGIVTEIFEIRRVDGGGNGGLLLKMNA